MMCDPEPNFRQAASAEPQQTQQSSQGWLCNATHFGASLHLARYAHLSVHQGRAGKAPKAIAKQHVDAASKLVGLAMYSIMGDLQGKGKGKSRNKGKGSESDFSSCPSLC